MTYHLPGAFVVVAHDAAYQVSGGAAGGFGEHGMRGRR
jgi:hypothetical protein